VPEESARIAAIAWDPGLLAMQLFRGGSVGGGQREPDITLCDDWQVCREETWSLLKKVPPARLAPYGPTPVDPVFHLLQMVQLGPGCCTAHRSSKQFRHFAPEMERCVRFQPIFVNLL
jgi:hypothetical protein